MSEVLEYIKQKKWVYQEVQSDHGLEARVQICPFCHKSGGHFYINLQTGVYLCHAGECGQAGTLYALKRHLNDVSPVTSFKSLQPQEEKTLPTEETEKIFIAHEALLKDRATMLYLWKRKFSLEAIKYFKLGIEINGDGSKWLIYPYFKGGMLKNAKKRTLPPSAKAFKRLFGGESILFNEDVLDDNTAKFPCDEIILTEGEADAISLWSNGCKAVVGATIGAGGIKAEWIDKLDRLQRIYFIYDSDEAGARGAYKFANRLGLERCYQIKLPSQYKDLNEYFIASHTLDDFLKLKAESKPFDVEGVKSLGGLIEKAIKSIYIGDTESEGISLPWLKLERLTGKWKMGDMVVLASRPKVGKTSFSINLLYYMATHGIPSLLYELEMTPERLMPRFVACHLGKDSKSVNNIEDLAKTHNDLKDIPLYFAYQYRKLNWKIVEDTIRMCYQRYGIKFMVFDNIHFLVRSEDQTREVSLLSNNLKLLAEELGIVIVAIERPRKTLRKIIGSEDLKDSADLEADADHIILLHREKVKDVETDQRITEGTFMPQTLVRVDGCRWDKGGDCMMIAHDEICRFEEM